MPMYSPAAASVIGRKYFCNLRHFVFSSILFPEILSKSPVLIFSGFNTSCYNDSLAVNVEYGINLQ